MSARGLRTLTRRLAREWPPGTRATWHGEPVMVVGLSVWRGQLHCQTHHHRGTVNIHPNHLKRVTK